MGEAMFTAAGIPFGETTELQRQLLAAYTFGMLFALGRLHKLTPPDVHALTILMLLDIFKYSQDQAVAFAEDLIQSSSGHGNPTTNAVIRRGFDGYRLWNARLMLELKSQIEDIFRIVGA
jgi:Immunity protein 48